MSVRCGTLSDMSDMSDKSDFIGVPQVQKKRLLQNEVHPKSWTQLFGNSRFFFCRKR